MLLIGLSNTTWEKMQESNAPARVGSVPQRRPSSLSEVSREAPIYTLHAFEYLALADAVVY